MHGGNEVERSNRNQMHNEPCKDIVQHRDVCWCNNLWGSFFSAAMALVCSRCLGEVSGVPGAVPRQRHWHQVHVKLLVDALSAVAVVLSELG
jgi:hypothetical protein